MTQTTETTVKDVPAIPAALKKSAKAAAKSKKPVLPKELSAANSEKPTYGDVIDTLKGTKKSAGRPKSSPRVYTFDVPEKIEGLPKQAVSILTGFSQMNGQELPEEKVQAFVQTLADTGELKTKQDPWRIFQYYRAKMISSGYLKMAKA